MAGSFVTEASPDGLVMLEHVDGLFGYAMVLTRNRAEAEDLVQETYLRALEAMSRLRENSNIKGWLFTILRNIWLNELRRRKSAPINVETSGEGQVLDTLADTGKDAHDIFVNNENSAAIRKAINDLPLEFREVVVLREFHELSYHQIAGVLGCPPGTVMSRLGRARAKLRTVLSGRFGSAGSQLGTKHE